VVGAGVEFAFAARANDVARAMLIVAKKRIAAMHALFPVRLGWIERRIGSAWIRRDAPALADVS